MSSRWFKVGVSVGLFAFLLISTDLQTFRRHLSTAPLAWVIVAFLGYLLGQIISAYKWQVLARPLGFIQPLRVFVSYYFSGMYLNLFAPSTVAGDFGRSALLAGDRKRLGPALHSVVADRVSGLITLLWVCAVGSLLADLKPLPVSVRYGVIAITLGATGGWFLLPTLLGHAFPLSFKLRGFIERLIAPYQNAPVVLWSACGISLVFHFLQIGMQILLARALHIDTSVWALLVCIPLVSVLSGLPISFGGVGVREGGYVMLLTPLGVEREQALALGMLWSAVVLSANVTGGLALLLSADIKLPLKSKES
ncbi:MAG: lysylphosphatidylglycerol synthase transmembrane domain-containing protein [Candidatus Binatia bacterium]